MNKGFTLIELLVVVLIIGILAAIALPQYTKAVERSRVAEAAQWLGDLATAQSIFYMQHNHFATTLDDTASTGINSGDIAVPTTLANWTVPSGDAALGAEQAASITLTRNGGMYNGATLTITVQPNGNIGKSCTATTADKATEFTSIAQTAGYGTCTVQAAQP